MSVLPLKSTFLQFSVLPFSVLPFEPSFLLLSALPLEPGFLQFLQTNWFCDDIVDSEKLLGLLERELSSINNVKSCLINQSELGNFQWTDSRKLINYSIFHWLDLRNFMPIKDRFNSLEQDLMNSKNLLNPTDIQSSSGLLSQWRRLSFLILISTNLSKNRDT